MNLTTLKTLARIKGLRKADVAAMAGVSRQAVQQWWTSGETNFNVFSKTQERKIPSHHTTIHYTT